MYSACKETCHTPFPILNQSVIPYPILTNKHIHHWASFLLWLSVFTLFGAISPLFPSSILDTFWPGVGGGWLICCHLFLPFHTIHLVLRARILQWFAIPSSSGPQFVRTLHYDPSILALHGMTHSFIELHKPPHHNKAVIHEGDTSVLFSFSWTFESHSFDIPIFLLLFSLFIQ